VGCLGGEGPYSIGVGHSGVGLGRLVAGIVGSNPALGMDVCPRPSMLCCPVQLEKQTKGEKVNEERKIKKSLAKKEKDKVVDL
jgi:hypothetical protein